MIKIMFVCHGNICRSPMAEFILKKMVSDKDLSDSFYISSSATSSEEIYGGKGNPIYPAARRELLKNKIPIEDHRAVKLSPSDYPLYDLFVGMDNANIRNMKNIFSGDPDGKVKRLLDYTEKGGEVSDPWYSDRFDIAYSDIFEGCSALLQALIANKQ